MTFNLGNTYLTIYTNITQGEKEHTIKMMAIGFINKQNCEGFVCAHEFK